MANGLDPQIVNPILTGFVEEVITKKGNLPSTKPFEIATKSIDEYEGRLRVKATDKFDVAVFIGAISFYLNNVEMQAGRGCGAIIIYLDIEVADKLFKAAGMQVPYDEDDDTMMSLSGKLCQMMAIKLKEGLVQEGYVDLLLSEPGIFKNSISHGIDFSKDQEEKQELSFFYLKHKALVIDWTMASIPRK